MIEPKVLVVDDDRPTRRFLRAHLVEMGCLVVEAETGRSALAQCGPDVDLVLLDNRLPDQDGVRLLDQVRRRAPNSLVIVMTAYSDVAQAVSVMKDGAFHYTEKPLDLSMLIDPIQNALELARLRREIGELRAREAEPFRLDSMIGESPAIMQVKSLLSRVIDSGGVNVLLLGESGTGKDLAAKIIHYNSARAAKRFVNVTCSAIPEALLESQLFGYEQGAFTDARNRKTGLLEAADGGTLFLDEVGEMTPALQAKLLRFLEEQRFMRVGGSDDISVDVRVVAATNRDLAAEMRKGNFREDLYYRLQVVSIELPPLRERDGDLVRLLHYFADRYAQKLNRPARGFSKSALALLSSHTWPGNVRELRNAVERAILFADTELLTPKDFSSLAVDSGPEKGLELPPGIKLADLERLAVEQALARCDGNQTHAARLLGITRDQLRYRLAKYDLR